MPTSSQRTQPPRRLLPVISLAVTLAASFTLSPSAKAYTAADLADTLAMGEARIKAGNGHAAQELCTRVYASGDWTARVRVEYVWPTIQPLGLVQAVDMDWRNSVTAQLPVRPYYSRIAIYRAGLGCTVVPPGTSVSAVRAQAFRPAATLPAIAAPWPAGENVAETGWLPAPVAETVARQGDRLFEETRLNPSLHQNTTAYLVAKDGHLVFERYAPGISRSQPQPGWSMTKSLTGLIAGLMATDGLIRLEDPVGLPQWTTDSQKARITWRHLLNNAPGLKWSEEYEGVSDTGEMLYSRPNQGNWAANRPWDPEAAAPGAKFNYSTGFVNIAMLRMKQLLGNEHQSLYDYYQRRLFAPLGIRHGVVEPDAGGTPVGGARGLLRPVDWLRLGQLVVQHGNWNGAQLISGDYMSNALASSPAAARYGFYIWRKTGNPATEVAVFRDIAPRLPDDTIWFQGFMGQYVVMSPRHNLVVVRMGASHDKDETMRRVMTAFAEIHESFQH